MYRIDNPAFNQSLAIHSRSTHRFTHILEVWTDYFECSILACELPQSSYHFTGQDVYWVDCNNTKAHSKLKINLTQCSATLAAFIWHPGDGPMSRHRRLPPFHWYAPTLGYSIQASQLRNNDAQCCERHDFYICKRSFNDNRKKVTQWDCPGCSISSRNSSLCCPLINK